MKLANRIAAFIGLATLFKGANTSPVSDIIPADMKAYKPRAMKRTRPGRRSGIKQVSKWWRHRKARLKMAKKSRKINRQKSKRRASC